MEWIANTPRSVDLSNVPCRTDQTKESALRAYQKWRSRFIKGDPKATDSFSVAELKGIGMIGLYKQEKDA